MIRAICRASLIALTSSTMAIAIFGQPSVAPSAFEVASIRPSEAGNVGTQGFSSPGGKFTAINATLKSLIGFAYGVQDYQVFGASGWIDSAAYDIKAKAESNAGEDLRPMLRTLLADRFHLKVHSETKDLPVYVLVAGKNGPNLHAVEKAGIGVGIGRGRFNGRGADMPTLARVLSGHLERLVLDRTGVTGFYDFLLTFESDETRTADATGPSLLTALREQLGLRLESQKGQVEVLSIDHAEKPTDN